MTSTPAPSPLELFQLNHASLLLVMGKIRLLTDPWFEGDVFDGGWTLRWQNPAAYELAATATHLWISHPHADHLHHPTLRRIQSLNPNLTVLANRGYNYNVEKQMRALGFSSIVSLREQETRRLDEHCAVQRLGSGIIDSMLVIRWRNLTFLNLNDCVLQKEALRHIARKIGAIDLLLCNFNHAGKLLHYPEKSAAQVRGALKEHYRMQADILRARGIVPFASHHRYVSPLSREQNASLLQPADLENVNDISAKTISLYPGQRARLDFSPHSIHADIFGEPPAAGENIPVSSEQPWQDNLAPAIAAFEKRIAASFGPLRFLFPGLTVRILETGRILRLRHGRVREAAPAAAPDIEAHGEKIAQWFNHPFGTDAFVVGAHFRLLRPCTGRLKRLIALLLLGEAKIAPRYFLTPALWEFLLRRRHEALAALLSRRVSSSYQ